MLINLGKIGAIAVSSVLKKTGFTNKLGSLILSNKLGNIPLVSKNGKVL